MARVSSPDYPFLGHAGRILNSGQARTLLLTGNLNDLFYRPADDGSVGEYVPILDLLRHSWRVAGKILLTYELNGPIRFAGDDDRGKLKDAWLRWRIGLDADRLAVERMLAGRRLDAAAAAADDAFEASLKSAVGNPTVAFEVLRQLCLCSRLVTAAGETLDEDLVVLIEAADLALPDGEIRALSDADRRRLAICHDWFSDPGFLEADDSVVLLAESRSLLHGRIGRLPHILEVEIPAPGRDARRHYIAWFEHRHAVDVTRGAGDELADLTAGLSIHALAQLLKGAAHGGEGLTRKQVVAKVEDFVRSQLGEDVVEIKKPEHHLDDVVGFSNLKAFLREELIPRFRAGDGALPGAAVAGPIGSGKTFVFEAVAAELDMIVVVLKNLRSPWFGQTDVIFERLRRVLEALAKVVIFVDEADTQLGGLGAGTHATERRLTGKIQAMMSDPRLRGRVFWLLMTARIHLLSPDIRRPGRVGDLIIPVLDPEGDDRRAFLRWVLTPVIGREASAGEMERLEAATAGYSAAAFAALRAQLVARAGGRTLAVREVVEVVDDLLQPAIGDTRRFQTLQALLNCTRRRLLPDPDRADRRAWAEEVATLEARRA